MDKLSEDNFTHDLHVGDYPNVPLKYLAATTIIGEKVHDDKDSHIGEIKDIMIDVATGQIHYYVVEFGGFLGIGTKYFAIPFGLLKVDPVNKLYVFTQPKHILAKAPGFNQLHWPETDYHLVQDYWSFQ